MRRYDMLYYHLSPEQIEMLKPHELADWRNGRDDRERISVDLAGVPWEPDDDLQDLGDWHERESEDVLDELVEIVCERYASEHRSRIEAILREFYVSYSGRGYYYGDGKHTAVAIVGELRDEIEALFTRRRIVFEEAVLHRLVERALRERPLEEQLDDAIAEHPAEAMLQFETG